MSWTHFQVLQIAVNHLITISIMICLNKHTTPHAKYEIFCRIVKIVGEKYIGKSGERNLNIISSSSSLRVYIGSFAISCALAIELWIGFLSHVVAALLLLLKSWKKVYPLSISTIRQKNQEYIYAVS